MNFLMNRKLMSLCLLPLLVFGHWALNFDEDFAAAGGGGGGGEQDLAALRTYHYGSPDIVESPAEWFDFDGAGTIESFNVEEEGRENVVIPWEIDGVPVTAIGQNAFAESDIVSVIAPQTVTVIGDGAFSRIRLLASVSFPQAQTIGDYTFGGCFSLSSVSLPQAQTIGDDAFAGCFSLSSVSLPLVASIGVGAFSECSALTSVTIPQATSIGDYAFYYCDSLASVSLPQATAIGEGAFLECYALTSVTMGQNAPAEAAYVFDGITPLPTVYVTDPQATGWGATWNGAPVVRLPL